MAEIYLQDMVDDIRLDTLPANWTAFDMADFSSSKRLWDYQQGAMKNAIKVLWKYFKVFAGYQNGESLETNQERKQKFYAWYKDNGLEVDLDISLKKLNRKISILLSEYYEVEDSKISYCHFINRMSF